MRAAVHKRLNDPEDLLRLASLLLLSMNHGFSVQGHFEVNE